MENYLQGYLQVLPEYQRRRIEEIIQENQDLFNIDNLKEEEFKEIINRLAEDHEKLSVFVPQVNQLDADLFNAFFSNIHIDMNLMYLESQMIESASTNYSRIFDGILYDLEQELKALREKVNSLRLVSEGEDGLIVKSYSFNDKSQMETDDERYRHLFMDRDGSYAERAVIERNHDQNFLSLAKTKEVDCLHNKEGESTAKIRIEDQRGIPIPLSEAKRYHINNAIDGSEDTYWACVVLSDEPITMRMDK